MISIHPDTANLQSGEHWRYTQNFEWREPLGLTEVAELVQGHAWCPGKYRDGYRKGAAFQRAELIALDADDGKLTLDGARERFKDYIHIIGTTKSHGVVKNGVACDRFRVILKLSAPISSMQLFRNTAKHLVERNPECDQKPKDAGRFFYPCKHIVSIQLYGKTFDPVPVPELVRKPRDYKLEKQFKNVPTWIRAFLGYGVPEGMRNDTVLKISRALTKCGFSYDEILDLVRRSPISLPDDELERVIRNGRNYGRASL